MTLKLGGTQPLFTIYDLRFTAFMRQPRREKAEGGERLREGAELDVTVERILPGGVGLAHARGQTLLVALAAPGDLARVRVESVRARLAFASVKEILRPSPARVEHAPVRNLLGNYERGSHRVVDVAECPVAAPAVEGRLGRLRQALRE